MQHSTNAAPELGVHEIPRVLPAEVAIVQSGVGAHFEQILSKFLGTVEVVHVDEGVRGSDGFVVLATGAHHYGDHIVSVI